MLSLNNKGFGGHALEVREVVRKWTTGVESKEKLKAEFYKTIRAIEDNSMAPLGYVEPISMTDGPNWFEYTMPYIHGEPAHKVADFKPIADAIKASIQFRCRGRVSGFRLLARRQLDLIYSQKPELNQFDKRMSAMIGSSSDLYPEGFCHGDMGLSNILVSKEGIKCIDFTPAFLNSPLIDVATYDLSLNNDESLIREDHKKLRDELFDYFDKYRVNIILIKKLKILSWLIHTTDPLEQKRIRAMLND